MVIAVGNDAQWLALVRVLGADALLANEDFLTNAGRVTHRARCVAAVEVCTRRYGSVELKRRCEDAGVPVGEVRTVTEAIAGVAGSPLTGLPSSVGGAVFRPPPLLGEHSAEIRRDGWVSA